MKQLSHFLKRKKLANSPEEKENEVTLPFLKKMKKKKKKKKIYIYIYIYIYIANSHFFKKKFHNFPFKFLAVALFIFGN